LITADGKAYASWFRFFGAICTYDANVGGFPASGQFGDRNEKHRLSASWHVTICTTPLTEAADLVGTRFYPVGTITAVTELAIFAGLAGVWVDGGAV
jgi:hypothetical protein